MWRSMAIVCFFFQAEDGIRDLVRSRGLGDVYKRQAVTCVGFGYGLIEGLFPGTSQQPRQSDKPELHLRSVTTSRPRNINLVPIDYAFRPRLRGRLTLLRLALSRNPWTFGERVSHPLSRTLR
eukprot:TRINITY_DN507_c0_g1_i3.p1 TRINITY_DN507_c0_g1~~TRINITY_DN507_c0_g1_i3.p1  ORF type:complete len:123 (+),score=15.01 TRINITY_DN507_c0_g1_i3:68-436(+)